MDRQLLERLIGAGVLVVALVIVVPAILDGSDDADRQTATPATTDEPHRTHTIRPDRSTESPPVAREVTEPVSDTKEGQEPAMTAAVTSSKSLSETAVKPPQPVKPTPAVTKPVEKKVSPKPSAVSRPKPVEPMPKTGWVVQLGSFSSKQNARRLADEVSGRGFKTFLMPLDRSGKTLYRVRVGPRDTRAQATELAGRLAKSGYSGQVTR